jgi:hypothetical protein
MDDQPKSGNENQAKSVAPIVITTIIATLVVVGIVWVIFSSSSSPLTQQQSVTSNSEANPSVQTQLPNQAAPQQPAPSQNVAPVVQQPRYYTPMNFSPAAEAQRASFVNSCTSSGGTWGKCNCDFDYFIYNYGVIWLINENVYINVNGASSPEFRSASQSANQSCSVWSN